MYFFFFSIDLLSSSFKLFGAGFVEKLIATTANPVVGLFIGILATSIIQSSSSTTSIVVGLVASGALNITNAIPIIMGANVGTSVTNVLVSLGHVTRREEFRRAFSGATVHDFFNILSVAVLLPLERYTGYLEFIATRMEHVFEGMGGLHLLSPVQVIVKPLVHGYQHLLLDLLHLPKIPTGTILLVSALCILFFSLRQFVRIMRNAVTGRVETIIHEVLFQSPLRSFGLGLMLTALVQSSSITTSLIVPMIGAGILTVEQFFPYTLGANIGTTVTAIMAALTTASPAAVTIAFVHLMFNISGTLIFYPLRAIPIKLSDMLGEMASRRRYLAVVFIVFTFFLLPIILIIFLR